MSKLKDLFEGCNWKNKTLGGWPENKEEILYQWSEYEYEFASVFFKDTGAMILTDEDPVVERHLYYSTSPKGVPVLCVTQREKPFDVKAAAEGLAMMLDVSKVQESLNRVTKKHKAKEQV
ncbi:hypothetical protein [Salidesulfovibrio onnuriiensis]|uniref:hypothetical protein n=1 Tax=Salidesulfovibrio onnuriiensis TaxID=2583823 RepID=UPI0011CA358C|nr:hypothetical protein [Salidesulfovibrio onnuriiensis]